MRRFVVAERVMRVLAPGYITADDGRAWMRDVEFVDDYRRLTGGGLMDQADKKWTLRSLARSVRVDGDVAEAGAYRGLSAFFLAQALPGRLHLFDSFEGLSEPSGLDGGHWEAGVLSASEQECRHALARHAERVDVYKGWIPDRFGEVADRRFAFVHVDVDLYEPHADCIDFFWPRVVPGGMIVFDDYGSVHCPGARKAVDERLEVVELTTGQAFAVKS